MKVNVGPRGILQIDDAKIIFRNFTGRGDKFNREGDRNFCLVIDDQEIAEMLIDQGWNVKIKPPRDEDEDPFMFMKVKVSFGGQRQPNIYLVSGNSKNRLDEDTVDCLDNIDIAGVDLDIRPYDWEFNGKSGRTAYLQSIHVVQELDRFADVDQDMDW